jgi:hypothetical protein
MNSENKFPFLSDWCADYHKRSGLKVHPSSVPTDVVLEELMGQVMASSRHIHIITSTLELITERFNTVSQELKTLNELVVTLSETKKVKK